MLLELRLSGLGAIDEAELVLTEGFCAITGETGAGKTMLLTGLSLLLGGRADAGMVRAGHARAVVEGRFRVPVDGSVAARVREAGGDLDGDELLVVRSVAADGRSRAHVGGRSVPMTVLAGLAEELVAVHGQSAQRGLLRHAAQRDALDGYAGRPVADALRDWQAAFEELGAVRRRLGEVAASRRERVLEADALRHGLAEVAAVDPQPGEDRTLAEESRRLGHAETLRQAAQAAHRVLAGEPEAASGGGDAAGLVAQARTELASQAEHDPALAPLAERAAELSYLLADLATDLAGYLDGLVADPARLAAVEDRRSRLSGLTRRYAEDVDAVLRWAAGARDRLAEIGGDDDLVGELAARRDELLATLTATGQRLSAARAVAAGELAAAVSRELHGLGMPNAALRVEVRRRPDPGGLPLPGGPVAFGRHGVDDVELLLLPHSGAVARPLDRGASGGELSRLMLALELVLAGTAPVPVFVFDEVDAGVGGRAAIDVGERLARLASSAQVIVVTHLPQVAAFADRHVVVAKSDTGRVTASDVSVVDGEPRLRELSRMLGGLSDSELGRGHAEELLSVAAATRRSR